MNIFLVLGKSSNSATRSRTAISKPSKHKI
jgi:hypothetical protein